MTINREQAWGLLTQYNKDTFHLRHAITVENVMGWFAQELGYGEEQEFWSMVGLLHDLDEEHCDWEHDLSVHGPTSVELLKKEGVEDQELFDAICSHNPKSGVKAKTKLQYAVLAAVRRPRC